MPGSFCTGPELFSITIVFVNTKKSLFHRNSIINLRDQFFALYCISTDMSNEILAKISSYFLLHSLTEKSGSGVQKSSPDPDPARIPSPANLIHHLIFCRSYVNNKPITIATITLAFARHYGESTHRRGPSLLSRIHSCYYLFGNFVM